MRMVLVTENIQQHFYPPGMPLPTLPKESKEDALEHDFFYTHRTSQRSPIGTDWAGKRQGGATDSAAQTYAKL